MNKKIQSQVLKEVVEELVRFEIGKRGVTAEQQARHIIDIIIDKQKAEFRKMIKENRKEIPYVLCYGLKQDLTKKEEVSFMEMFVTLYEYKLLAKLGDDKGEEE